MNWLRINWMIAPDYIPIIYHYFWFPPIVSYHSRYLYLIVFIIPHDYFFFFCRHPPLFPHRFSSFPIGHYFLIIPSLFPIIPLIDADTKCPCSQFEKPKQSTELRQCGTLLKELLGRKHKHNAWPFYHPVDHVALGLHDYLTVIKSPMDLGTIKVG